MCCVSFVVCCCVLCVGCVVVVVGVAAVEVGVVAVVAFVVTGVEVQRRVRLLILVYTTRSPVSNRLRMAPGCPLVPVAHLAELLAL